MQAIRRDLIFPMPNFYRWWPLYKVFGVYVFYDSDRSDVNEWEEE